MADFYPGCVTDERWKRDKKCVICWPERKKRRSIYRAFCFRSYPSRVQRLLYLTLGPIKYLFSERFSFFSFSAVAHSRTYVDHPISLLRSITFMVQLLPAGPILLFASRVRIFWWLVMKKKKKKERFDIFHYVDRSQDAKSQEKKDTLDRSCLAGKPLFLLLNIVRPYSFGPETLILGTVPHLRERDWILAHVVWAKKSDLEGEKGDL